MERPKTFIEATRESPPAASLVHAVELVAERDAALDLGAGALSDVKYLLNSGFHTVMAVDSDPATQTEAREIKDSRLQVMTVPFQSFTFPQNSFDLVNAQFSLPFTPPASFDEVFSKAKNSLREHGIFVGNLFGPNDSWKGIPLRGLSGLTFHSLDQVRELLSDMEIIDLKEKEYDGVTAVGSSKHWHLVYFIARK